MTDLIKSFIAGIVGVLIQLLLHYRELKTLANKATTPLTFKQYLKDDSINAIISVLAVLLCLLAWDSFAHLPAWVMNYIVGWFAFVGWGGAQLLVKVFGTAQKKLYDIIDQKTNIADNKLLADDIGRPDDRNPPPPPKPPSGLES